MTLRTFFLCSPVAYVAASSRGTCSMGTIIYIALIFNDLSRRKRNCRQKLGVRCNLSIDGIVCSRVWRVTLSLDGLLSAPDILRNTLNSLCHVVFVVKAFIDLKRPSELVATVWVERRTKGGKCNWFDYKLLIIRMRISAWPKRFWIFHAITRRWYVTRNLWNAGMNKQRSLPR